MNDYVCITVHARPGEEEPDFSARLSAFWTHMLRDAKPDFEKVYAETTAFGEHQGSLSRQYLAELSVADRLERELAAAKLDFLPIDRDDLYSKFEATSPEWMQIEH